MLTWQRFFGATFVTHNLAKIIIFVIIFVIILILIIIIIFVIILIIIIVIIIIVISNSGTKKQMTMLLQAFLSSSLSFPCRFLYLPSL